MKSVMPANCRSYAVALAAAWFALASPGASAQDAPAAESKPSGATLSIATWGGAYGQSQEIAYFQPFTQKTGVKIKTETYDGTLAAIKDKIGASSSPFDIVDLSQGALDALCRDGLLEQIDSSALTSGPGGQSVSDDFLSGGITSCGIASVAWSTAIAFDRQAFTKAQPSKIADLLDIQRFPGKRALPNGPRYTLELALLADGVDPADIYTQLGTPEGVDRAFKALDKIKAQILWWDKAEDAISMLLHGEEDLRPLPFVERRARLEAWHAKAKPPRTDVSEVLDFGSIEELEKLWSGARETGIEGLMLKRRDSPYLAGRPKGHWYKWKRAPLTLDAVLMYAQRGSGKRSSYYSDYTFGAWREGEDGAPELVPVGKSYFGFTDEELRQLDSFVRNHTVDSFGPVRQVEPRLVFEVAFDSVHRSSRHKSGVAMTFLPCCTFLQFQRIAGTGKG